MKVLKDSLNVKKWLLCGSVPAAVLNFFLLTHSHISVTQQQIDSVNREPATAALAPAGCKPSPCRLELTDGTHLPCSYVSFLGVGAQLALQAGRQPLVRVVRHQAHQLHPLLDLQTQGSQRKCQSGKTADLSVEQKRE